ncbi:MAG: hypothetical protein AB1489_14990 [Acidobacteriota bacterium]
MSSPTRSYSTNSPIAGSLTIPNRHEDLESQFLRLRSLTSDFKALAEELKNLHQSPDEYWYAMGSRLRKIANERLYRWGGYRSFSDFCQRGLGYSRQHVYKLMKVVEFIDQRWEQAQLAEERQTVERLFSMGFTKLYILHALPTDKLDLILKEGIIVVINGEPTCAIALETATVGQLKRALVQEQHSNGRQLRSIAKSSPLTSNLIQFINIQSKALLRVIEQCRYSCDSQESFVDHLQTIEQYATTIAEGIDALMSSEK